LQRDRGLVGEVVGNQDVAEQAARSHGRVLSGGVPYTSQANRRPRAVLSVGQTNFPNLGSAPREFRRVRGASAADVDARGPSGGSPLKRLPPSRRLPAEGGRIA